MANTMFYRSGVRRACRIIPTINVDKIDDDSYFESFLATEYKAFIDDNWYGSQMVVIASGLLTFGHLDVISDIVKSYRPHVPGKTFIRVMSLAHIIMDIFPLPSDIQKNIRDNGFQKQQAQMIEKWVLDNRDNLVWNAETLAFDLGG